MSDPTQSISTLNPAKTEVALARCHGNFAGGALYHVVRQKPMGLNLQFLRKIGALTTVKTRIRDRKGS